MEKILSAQGASFVKTLALVTLMAIISLVSEGMAWLVGALFIGYSLAAAYLFTMVIRLMRSMGKSKSAARREMLWGLALRMMLIFAVLFTAIKIDFTVFLTVVGGFFIFWILTVFHLIIANFGDKKF